MQNGLANKKIAHKSPGIGVVIGGSGLIGGALVYYFKNRVAEVGVLTPNSKRLNLVKPEDIRLYFQQYKPAFIVNSAIASINSTVELAYEINYLGTLNLASICSNPPNTKARATMGPISHNPILCICKSMVVRANPARPTTAGLPWDVSSLDMELFL